MFKDDDLSVLQIPERCGPYLQANDFVHGHFRSIYVKLMRARIGLQNDLTTRPPKPEIDKHEVSGLRKGLDPESIAEVAAKAWEAIPQEHILAAYIATGWISLEEPVEVLEEHKALGLVRDKVLQGLKDLAASKSIDVCPSLGTLPLLF